MAKKIDIKEVLPTAELPAEKLLNTKYYRTVNIDVAAEEAAAAKLKSDQEAEAIVKNSLAKLKSRGPVAAKAKSMSAASAVKGAKSAKADDSEGASPDDYKIMLRGFGFKID